MQTTKHWHGGAGRKEMFIAEGRVMSWNAYFSDSMRLGGESSYGLKLEWKVHIQLVFMFLDAWRCLWPSFEWLPILCPLASFQDGQFNCSQSVGYMEVTLSTLDLEFPAFSKHCWPPRCYLLEKRMTSWTQRLEPFMFSCTTPSFLELILLSAAQQS